MPTNPPIQGEGKQVRNKRDKNGRLLPGNTANPAGRPPKEWTWRSLLLEAAEAVDPASGVSVKNTVAAALVAKAAAGDVAAIKEFGDRIDGKPKQAVEHTGEEGGPIVIVTKVPNADD